MAENVKGLAMRYKHDGVVYELDSGKIVHTSGEQSIDGKKVFNTVPQVQGTPVAAYDVVNKAYVDGLIQKPSFDIELQIGVTALNSWNAFSHLNILLANGKRLEAKYVEEGIKAGSDPAKVVLVMTDNPDAEIPEPELKQASFFDTYELSSNEYACEFYNANAMGVGSIHSDQRQANPWIAYLVERIATNQKAYYLKLVIKQLQDAVSSVQFHCGDMYNKYVYPPKNFLFKASCNGVTTKEQVSKDNPGNGELIKFNIPADALPIRRNYVDLVSEQTINGVKTFSAAPKSLAEAVDGNDLITKDFATKNFFARNSDSARNYDILVKMKNDGTWVGFTQFKVLLSNGTRLDIKHLEEGSSTTVTQPLVAVFKTVTDSAAAIEAPQRQAKTFFDSYQLEEGEYKGTVSFYKVVGKFNPAGYDINPWNVYVGNGNANTYDGIYGVHIEQLDKGLRGVNFKFGDAVTSYAYTCQQCGIVFTTDLGSLEVEYKGDMSDATEATIELPSDSDILGGFVTVEKDQGISGVKTFKKKVFITDPDQASEMATGQVVTTENLQAIGLVAKPILNAQYICVSGKVPELGTSDSRDTFYIWLMKLTLESGERLQIIHAPKYVAPTRENPEVISDCIVAATNQTFYRYPEQSDDFIKNYQLKDKEYRAKIRTLALPWRDGLGNDTDGKAAVAVNANFASLACAGTDGSDQEMKSFGVLIDMPKIASPSSTPAVIRLAEIIIYGAPKVVSVDVHTGWIAERKPVARGLTNINIFTTTSPNFSDFSKIPHNNNLSCNYDNSTNIVLKSNALWTDYSVDKNYQAIKDAYSPDELIVNSYLPAVTTVNNQEIGGVKTFSKPPKSSQAPAEDSDLTNKKYVDDELAKLVARIAALEAAKPQHLIPQTKIKGGLK